MDEKKDDGRITLTLRVPKDLHGDLEASAAKAGRSMNAEIIGRLLASYANERERRARFRKGLPDTSDEADKIAQRVVELLEERGAFSASKVRS